MGVYFFFLFRRGRFRPIFFRRGGVVFADVALILVIPSQGFSILMRTYVLNSIGYEIFCLAKGRISVLISERRGASADLIKEVSRLLPGAKQRMDYLMGQVACPVHLDFSQRSLKMDHLPMGESE